MEKVLNIVLQNIQQSYLSEKDLLILGYVSKEIEEIVNRNWDIYFAFSRKQNEKIQHVYLLSGRCMTCDIYTNTRNVLKEDKPYQCPKCMKKNLLEYRSCKNILKTIHEDQIVHKNHLKELFENCSYILINNKKYYCPYRIYGYLCMLLGGNRNTIRNNCWTKIEHYFPKNT